MKTVRTVFMMAAVTSGLAGRAWAQQADLIGWGYNSYGQINTPSNLSGVTHIARGRLQTQVLLVGLAANRNAVIDTQNLVDHLEQDCDLNTRVHTSDFADG